MITFNSMVCEIGLTTYEKATKIPRAKIKTSTDAANYFRQIWENDFLVRESMYALFMNRANNVVKYSVISKGGTAGTIIDVKIVAKLALETLAWGVILCHNHPSGNTEPSESDIKVTNKVRDGLETLDIGLLDHIIIHENSYFSFTDEGVI